MKQKQLKPGPLLGGVLWIGANVLLGVLLSLAPSWARAFSLTQAARATAVTPVPTPPVAPSPDSYLQFYGSILAALATITAAVIGGVFIVYQVRKSNRLQRENQQMQNQLQVELERQRHRSELGKMRYSDRLDAGSQHFSLPKSPLRNASSGMQELPERKKMLLP